MQFCFSLFTQVLLLTRVVFILDAPCLKGTCGLQLNTSMRNQLEEARSQPYQKTMNVLIKMRTVLHGQLWENVKEILSSWLDPLIIMVRVGKVVMLV